ncbi:hypothetical protein [Shimia abyssi]|uniref:Uncharacterized protein n=1 Tax=Shimia abyssi TaxID=1662395 RepID=A0A2P8FGQ3_9RHOB|nr:hypothetical protein [Shimia abyssi]PSL20913.1 hypothetical protein CLV88_10230 [Shimia abyssi]
MKRMLASITIILIAGCSPQAPDQQIDDGVAGAEPYPDLIPLEQVLVVDTPRLSENSEDDLEARANRLRRRSQELRNTPVQ